MISYYYNPLVKKENGLYCVDIYRTIFKKTKLIETITAETYQDVLSTAIRTVESLQQNAIKRFLKHFVIFNSSK